MTTTIQPWQLSLPNVLTAQTRLPVAVLGATGTVGQTLVRLLAHHPWFRVAELAASERSAGRSYGDAAPWLSGEHLPEIAAMEVQRCDPGVVTSPIVFSALDASVAGEVEQNFARAGRLVLTNAHNHRMCEDVPLVVPEVNADHLELLERQRAERGWTGGIVANGNCAAIVAVLALAPLHAEFGLRKLLVTTLQAVSGAGYPGVPSLDILGNVIPYIGGDEEGKIERETCRMLGRIRNGAVTPLDCAVSAQVSRVPVEHGHTACLTMEFERHPSAAEAIEVLRDWKPATDGLRLPSAPDEAVAVLHERDRPQPRHDVARGGGMTVSVGRVREDPVLDLRMVACGHNTIRGAAGAALLNAELLVARHFSTA